MYITTSDGRSRKSIFRFNFRSAASLSDGVNRATLAGGPHSETLVEAFRVESISFDCLKVFAS